MLGLVLGGLPIGHVVADTEGDTPATQLKSLFEEVLRDPANLELNLRYAELSEKLGDPEAAIGALERLLIYAPDLSNIRLQLGLLYLSIGSYDVARSYLEAIADAPDLTPEQRDEAAQGLAKVAQSATRGKFSGVAIFGVQAQSNPANAPGSPVFLVAGVNKVLSGHVTKRSDADWFAQGAATYTYDLRNEEADTIEANGAGYTSSYRRVHVVDMSAGQLDLGPRLSSAHLGFAGGTLRIYGLTNDVQLGGAPFYWGYGGGVQITQLLNDTGTEILANGEVQELDYHDSANYPTASQLNGSVDHYSVTGVQPLSENISLILSAIYNQQNARAKFFSDQDYAVAGGVAFEYHVAWLPMEQAWSTNLSVAGHYIHYDGADPTVITKTKRADRQWQFSINQVVPLTDSLALTGQVFRDVLSSNIRNYSYGNTSMLVGLQISF
jgi:tetratricopeptide (TPR) repeat protein